MFFKSNFVFNDVLISLIILYSMILVNREKHKNEKKSALKIEKVKLKILHHSEKS